MMGYKNMFFMEKYGLLSLNYLSHSFLSAALELAYLFDYKTGILVIWLEFILPKLPQIMQIN